MRKLIKALVGYMPVSRRKYQEMVVNINTVLDGFLMSEEQHSQNITMIMRDLVNLRQMTVDKRPKQEKAAPKNEGDPAFT